MLYVIHLMLFNVKAHQTITKKEEYNEESSKLLNDQKNGIQRLHFPSL